jgi:2-enoate reductase
MPEAIRPCIGCNQACIHRYGQIGVVNCAVNPLVGRPESYAPQRALTSRRVVVVGGGLVGCEMALGVMGRQRVMGAPPCDTTDKNRL